MRTRWRAGRSFAAAAGLLVMAGALAGLRAAAASAASCQNWISRQNIAIPFTTGAEFRDYFKQCYGPTIAVYRHLAADTERAAELGDALADLGEQNLAATGTGTMSWDYQLVTAVRI